MERNYLVWSNEHRAWWRADSSGYTRNVAQAGLYTRDDAISISHKARDGWEPGDLPDEIPVLLADTPRWVQMAIKHRAD